MGEGHTTKVLKATLSCSTVLIDGGDPSSRSAMVGHRPILTSSHSLSHNNMKISLIGNTCPLSSVQMVNVNFPIPLPWLTGSQEIKACSTIIVPSPGCKNVTWVNPMRLVLPVLLKLCVLGGVGGDFFWGHQAGRVKAWTQLS